MAKVTVVCLLISTVVLLAAFGQGMGVLRGGDVSTHLQWAVATLVAVLSANLLAIVHALQSERIIRSLRSERTTEKTPVRPIDGLTDARQL
jgi:hypothetical protein